MSRTREHSLSGLKLPKGTVIDGGRVRLRSKKLADARNDYTWQSDPEMARLDAAPALSIAFAFYLLDYADQLHSRAGNRFPFAVETLEGRHIGNCTCYDVDTEAEEAQLGIMIGDRDYWDRGYGADAVTAMVGHVFGNTDLRRIYLKTLGWNRRAQRCFEKCGFTPCGSLSRDGDDFLVMELTRGQWEKREESRD